MAYYVDQFGAVHHFRCLQSTALMREPIELEDGRVVDVSDQAWRLFASRLSADAFAGFYIQTGMNKEQACKLHDKWLSNHMRR